MLNDQINKLNPLMIRYEPFNCHKQRRVEGKRLETDDKTHHKMLKVLHSQNGSALDSGTLVTISAGNLFRNFASFANI